MAKRRLSILGFLLLLALVACTARPAPTPAPTAAARPALGATATRHPAATPTLPPDCGADVTIRDDTGALEVQVPCGATPDGAVFTLEPASECILPEGWRPLGGAFKLDIEPGQPAATGQPSGLTQPITLTFTVSDGAWTALSREPYWLDPSSYAIYYSPTGQSADRTALPTTVDEARRTATARTLNLGYFQPAARYGPGVDDRINDTPLPQPPLVVLAVNGPPREDLFDIAEDEDWFGLWAVAGVTYTIQTRDLAPGVDTVLTISSGGNEVLATDNNSGGGKASRIEWQPPYSWIWHVGVSRAPGSAYGCAARYALEVTAAPATLTLHNSGQIEYWAGADWVPYTRPSMALAPGFHDFRFNGQEAELRIGAGSVEETVAIVRPAAGEWFVPFPEKVEYLDNGWQPAYGVGYGDDCCAAWVCEAPGLRKELTVRVTYEGATMEKTQDIIADPVIDFPAGRVHSASGACTQYYSADEWRPFRNDMLLLPLTYTFRFNDGMPDAECTVVAGTQTDIH